MDTQRGYWTGKKRPDLINTAAAKTMFSKGFTPWNKGKTDRVIKKCKGCGKTLEVKRNKAERTKWCSRSCMTKYSPFSKTKKECPNCGKKILSRSRFCRSCSQTHQDSTRVKLNKSEYVLLHQWVRRQLGSPRKCEFCGTEDAKIYQWANKSHTYLKDLSDWIRLCPKCHKNYDLRRSL